jgi:hypothetical protein
MDAEAAQRQFVSPRPALTPVLTRNSEYDPEFGTAEDMFKDLNLSRDLVEEFHRKNGNPESLKLNVMVLQQSVWPFSRPQTDVDLPVEVSYTWKVPGYNH